MLVIKYQCTQSILHITHVNATCVHYPHKSIRSRQSRGDIFKRRRLSQCFQRLICLIWLI